MLKHPKSLGYQYLLNRMGESLGMTKLECQCFDKTDNILCRDLQYRSASEVPDIVSLYYIVMVILLASKSLGKCVWVEEIVVVWPMIKRYAHQHPQIKSCMILVGLEKTVGGFATNF